MRWPKSTSRYASSGVAPNGAGVFRVGAPLERVLARQPAVGEAEERQLAAAASALVADAVVAQLWGSFALKRVVGRGRAAEARLDVGLTHAASDRAVLRERDGTAAGRDFGAGG